MIVSHQYRFIYIKTLKTAGTSLEIALAKFCGTGDVITPIDRGDEATRRALGYRGAQNARPRLAHLVTDLPLSVRTSGDILKFYNHMPATMVRDRLPSYIWNSYYKFTTVRHPLDLAISLYFWRKRTQPELRDIGHFLRRHGNQLYRNTEIAFEDGAFLLDGFARFENFSEDLDRIGERIGLPESLWEGFRDIRAKGGVRARGSNGVALLNEEEREVVRFICAREYEHYGYE